MDSKNQELQQKMQQPNWADNRKMERLALLLYSVHHICILATALIHQETWGSMDPAVVVTLFLASWIIYICRFQDMHARVAQYSIMLLINFTIYSIHAHSLESVLLQFCAIVVVLGVIGFFDYIYIALGFLAINLVYHIFIGRTVTFDSFTDGYYLTIQVGNVLLIITLVFLGVRMRRSGAKTMMEVIAELKRAERSKDDFMANVSHEIRTPINTISGMSNILLQEKEPAKMLEEIQAIQGAGNSLMGVVSDILDFTELQSGKVEIVAEPYNITSTVNDIINMVNGSKKQKQVEFIVDVDANLPQGLIGDEKKIRRVIMNLLSNAFKFTNDGGVQLTIGFRRESYGINLLISVKDTGIGMEQKSVENLFSSYNQVDTGRTRKKGGIGLGLAISNAIVRGMGGVMSVRSQLGNGTTVSAAIPQKVTDDRPIVHVDNAQAVQILTYVDVERFAMSDVRDFYNNTLRHIASGMNVSMHICRNLAEVKRRIARDTYTHLFLAMPEYQADAAYFNELATKMCVTVLYDRNDERRISSPDVLRIYKPLCILSAVSVINGHRNVYEINRMARVKSFVAEEVEILVVDDNLMNIRVMEGLLGNYQIHVSRALSGYEALEKIYDRKYDLIFMDHMMPEMDGIETMHRIRKLGSNYCETVPIVALTANAISGAREMLLAEGFNDFLEKPVEISALERMLLKTIRPEKIHAVEVENDSQDTSIIYAAADASDGVPAETKRSLATAEQTGDATAQICVGDLDVASGICYCGGEELYRSILQEYVRKDAENYAPIEKLYQKQDWKNYIIAVHAIKSSMKTIGAMPLSEMAKKLEAEGKNANYDYIHAHHAQMIAEYQRVLTEIAHTLGTTEESAAAERIEKPKLQDAIFDEKAIAFENAMYALDAEAMLAIVEDLGTYSYDGIDMKQELASVHHKVEMSDYMSASETLIRIKAKLQNKG